MKQNNISVLRALVATLKYAYWRFFTNGEQISFVNMLKVDSV